MFKKELFAAVYAVYAKETLTGCLEMHFTWRLPYILVSANIYDQFFDHCVVIFFWSSGIMECTCMLFTFENGVLLMR